MGLRRASLGWRCTGGLGEESFGGAGVVEHAEFRVAGVGCDGGRDLGQAAVSVGYEPAPEGHVFAREAPNGRQGRLRRPRPAGTHVTDEGGFVSKTVGLAARSRVKPGQ